MPNDPLGEPQAQITANDNASGAPHSVWGRILVRRVRLEVLGFLPRRDDPVGQVERGLAIARTRNDQTEIAFCLWTLAEIAVAAREFGTALPYYQDSLRHYRELNDRFGTARVLQRLGMCFGNYGDFSKFVEFVQQSLDLARAIGDPIGTANCLYNLGSAATYAGQYDEAEVYVSESLAIRRTIGDLASVAVNLGALAQDAFVSGKALDQVIALARESLKTATEINHIDGKGMAQFVLGLVDVVHENYVRAKQLFAECYAIALNPSRTANAVTGLALAACGMHDYGEARRHIQYLVAYTAKVPLHYFIKWSLPISAILLEHEGQTEWAVELLGLASAPPGSMRGWTDKCPLIVHLRERLESQIPPSAFAAALKRGGQIDPQTVPVALLDWLQTLPGDPATAMPSKDSIVHTIIPVHDQAETLIEPLSERELEVLRLACNGLSNAEIAQRLFLAIGTVKVHMRHIYNKLGASTRAQAIAQAQTLNLL